MIAPLDPATTAREMVASLRRHRWASEFVMPNFTPSGWWECDLFVLTKAGYFREFEVKVSRGDFFRDLQKSREVGPYVYGEKRSVALKSNLLAAGDPAGPSQFWYVTPPGLLARSAIPEWAGLIEMVGNGPQFAEREIVPAPKLHRVKADSKVRLHALEACYWRMHRLLR